ncbi:hypothetical protein Tco_0382285 [Tanacetum coccineum]
MSNTAYSSQQINTAYPLPLDTVYRSSGTEAEIFYFRAKILPFFKTNPTDCLSLVSGDDEVELNDEESSNDEDDIAEFFRIETNIFDYETPLCSAFKEVDPDLLTNDILGFKTYEDYKDDWIYEWNKDVPWVDEKP